MLSTNNPMTGLDHLSCYMQVAPSDKNRKGKLLIPDDEVARVMEEVAPLPGPTGLLKLAGIKNIVEGWCANTTHALASQRCVPLNSGITFVPSTGASFSLLHAVWP